MNQPKKKAHNIYYLGSDKGFFQNIIQRYRQNYTDLNFNFPILEVKSEQGPETLFLELLKEKAEVIYIDFCEYQEKMLYLAELLSRDPLYNEVPLVGLVDKKEDVVHCLGAGVDFIYVKGGEFHDLVYAPMKMSFPKKVKKPQFAKAKMSREVDLIDDFRLGYIAPTYIHVEGNFYLEEGKKVFFKTEIPKTNVPSQNFIVKNRQEENLYYDFNYSYDLEFVYVDEPEDTTEAEDDAMAIEDEKARLKAIKEAKFDLRQRQAEYADTLKRAQKKHKEWVEDKMDPEKEKKTKVLIVDGKMRIFSSNAGSTLDKQPYSLRCQTSFDENFSTLERLRPAIVAYQIMGEYGPKDREDFLLAQKRIADPEGAGTQKIENPDREKKIQEMVEAIPEREKEEMNFIGILIQLIKKIENYSPVIILFGCYFKTSRALQDSFQYPMLVTHSENLHLDVILNLAAIYEKKQTEKMENLIKAKVTQMKAKDPQRYRRLTESDFQEKKMFVKKSNSLSYGSIKNPVVLSMMTESEVEFKTELHLPMKTYRLDFPLPLSIHLVPIEEGKDFLEEKGLRTYRGIIHSISETDKKRLRTQINEVFFEPLKEKRSKEMSEFKELNEKVLSEKQEKDKEHQENAEKEAQEELGISPEGPELQDPVPQEEAPAQEAPNQEAPDGSPEKKDEESS